MGTRLLIETGYGYEINFGKHKGEDLLEAIAQDYDYFDWILWKADFDDEGLVEIVAEYMEEIQQEGSRRER